MLLVVAAIEIDRGDSNRALCRCDRQRLSVGIEDQRGVAVA